MKMKLTGVLAVLFGMMVLVSCGEEGEIDPVLNVSVNKLEFDEEGGDMEISITSNSEWSISNQASSWLQLSQTAGNSGSTLIQIAAVPNATGLTRSTILNITSPNGQDRRITVLQISSLYPSYNTSPLPPDATGMNSNATELAAKMKLGWNIGNTMEAPGGEEGWGNPMITEEYVKFVKQQGFNAIRLPVSWDWHHIADRTTAQIDPAWLSRVKEVVEYCVNNDMYVLLNIHWDGGWLENNVTPDKKDSVNAKQKAYWEQIATVMRDFDEHLMFASANEPNVHDAVQMEVLHSYHQNFVNTVRATGGRNSYRVLVIQGPDTNIEKSYEMMDMPTDEIEDRMMAEVHFYSPSQFCILLDGDASWGNMVYYWGEGFHSTIEPDRNATWGEEAAVDMSFSIAKKQFVDKGIPVILGEYGAYRRNDMQHVPLDLETHNNSVDHWISYVTKKAIENGLIPFWWDTGWALDRADYVVKDQRTIDALMEGGK